MTPFLYGFRNELVKLSINIKALKELKEEALKRLQRLEFERAGAAVTRMAGRDFEIMPHHLRTYTPKQLAILEKRLNRRYDRELMKYNEIARGIEQKERRLV